MYLIDQQKSLEEFYSESKEYQLEYAFKDTLKARVNQVAFPKDDYVINIKKFMAKVLVQY
ncbi:hypothetical protein CLCAR_2195 [Clostridium carboxidivorans P7]|nr:hypothetical protein CLCAR_2195 [Clostridium carboxidivorans P7]